MRLALIVLSFCVSSAVFGQNAGFFRVDGTRIVDSQGNSAMKKGMGLGGWLMPEGYMLDLPHQVGSASKFRAAIRALIGDENAETFWQLYTENYVNEKDIAALAAWGFDHIRLPFHYNVLYDLDTATFKEEGFAIFDEFIEWCRTHDLYVVLDMHATPGAQSAGDIADSDGVARLWTEPDPYQDLTVDIWTEIATRYADETQIIGYDLINEPVTPDEVADGAQALRDLYVRLTNAVRAVDKNHILFIEGNYWATTFDKLTPPFDANMVYAFHKYWNATDRGSIGYLLSLRSSQQRPLWLGETGENSNVWLYDMAKLMRDENIGWNFWTHKQIQATVPPLSATIKPGYRRVINYWGGSGSKPTVEEARDGLFEMARGLHIDSTRLSQDVLRALFDPAFFALRYPFKDHVIPGVINAAEYDGGMQNVTYFDRDYRAISGSPGGGNTGGRFRNDGVDIEASTDPQGFEYNVGWMETGEWMEYTVRVDTAGVYDVNFRIASQSGGGQLELLVNRKVVGTITAPRTNGWQSWQDVSMPGVTLTGGTHILRTRVVSTPSFNFNNMTFRLVTPTATEDPELVVANRLDVYPTPAAGTVHFRIGSRSGGAAELAVFDVLGRRVMKRDLALSPGDSMQSTDVSGWVPGVYFYRLTQAGDIATGSLVVSR